MSGNHKRKSTSKAFLVICLITGGLVLVGCDSGEKAVDKVTGNEAVKEYHKLKKDVEKIADEQAKRYEDLLEENDKNSGTKR